MYITLQCNVQHTFPRSSGLMYNVLHTKMQRALRIHRYVDACPVSCKAHGVHATYRVVYFYVRFIVVVFTLRSL